jgi:hypothetical protein
MPAFGYQPVTASPGKPSRSPDHHGRTIKIRQAAIAGKRSALSARKRVVSLSGIRLKSVEKANSNFWFRAKCVIKTLKVTKYTCWITKVLKI